MSSDRYLWSGNEAVAHAALRAGVSLGTGYPGTPSTEILENFDVIGGRAQWAPNEKVALEVGLGVAYAGARTLVTMKHVGINVAADPLFTAAYTGVTGGLVLISADDPGMASSQNEQDNRYYARAAGVVMLEPADSQEAYDFTLAGFEISERFGTVVILRLTTRVCHSQTVVVPQRPITDAPAADYHRDVPGRVMIPAYARPAHKKMRQRLAEVASWNETSDLNRRIDGDGKLGIITSGVAYQHVLEAAPEASILKLGLTWPLPLELCRQFANSVDKCIVIDEGENLLAESLLVAGIDVQAKDEMFRYGELNVARVRRILAGDTSPEPPAPRGKPPALCQGCPHRTAFEALRDRGCIVTGDIGCYTLGVLPPFEAMDTCVCMGASIGVGLGMRHSLPAEQARKVVSVIGDSTFAHSGLTGLMEMVYNPPPTGHVVIILDNGTTAMTGMQEHPGTGRKLSHEPTNRVVFEDVARAMGVEDVTTVDPLAQPGSLEKALDDALANEKLSLIIARRPCLLAAARIRQYEQAGQEAQA
jgi:indolepyruvate ferredoxin oxidoreductase alpha subunit